MIKVTKQKQLNSWIYVESEKGMDLLLNDPSNISAATNNLLIT